MNNEEKFKKNLEDLLSKKEFPFDESNWEKARVVLDAAKERRTRMFPFILAGIILLSSVISGTYFLSNIATASENKNNTTAEKTIPELASASKTTKLYANNDVHSQEVNTARKQELKKADKIKSPEITNIETTRKASQTKQYEQPKSFESSATNKGNVNSKPTLVENKNATVISIKTTTTEVESQEKNTSTTNEKNKESTDDSNSETYSGAVSKYEKQDSKHSNSNREEPVKDAHQKEFAIGASGLQTGLLTHVNNPSNSATPVSKEKGLGAPENVIHEESKKESDDFQENFIDSSDVTNSDSKEKEIDEIVHKDSITKSLDLTVVQLPEDNDGSEITSHKIPTILFSVEAGANYMFGWKNAEGRDANSFNPVIGINYFKKLGVRVSFSGGIHYSSVGKLSFSEYTSKVTRYGIGEESQVTVFTPTKIHYLIIPLRFNYAIDPKNSFGLGCNIAYLLNIDSEVESYKESFDKRYDITLSKTRGYTEGFNKYDTQISAFYKRNLYPQLSLNLEIFYGLADIKNNKFFNANYYERNTGLKLTLVYNILKK